MGPTRQHTSHVHEVNKRTQQFPLNRARVLRASKKTNKTNNTNTTKGTKIPQGNSTSAAVSRARDARVRAEYPNQLDYSGICAWKRPCIPSNPAPSAPSVQRSVAGVHGSLCRTVMSCVSGVILFWTPRRIP
jgi:hypothetical protein